MEYFSQGNFIFKYITTIQECLCYIITFSICMIILLMLIFYFCCWRYGRYIFFDTIILMCRWCVPGVLCAVQNTSSTIKKEIKSVIQKKIYPIKWIIIIYSNKYKSDKKFEFLRSFCQFAREVER